MAHFIVCYCLPFVSSLFAKCCYVFVIFCSFWLCFIRLTLCLGCWLFSSSYFVICCQLFSHFLFLVCVVCLVYLLHFCYFQFSVWLLCVIVQLRAVNVCYCSSRDVIFLFVCYSFVLLYVSSLFATACYVLVDCFFPSAAVSNFALRFSFSSQCHPPPNAPKRFHGFKPVRSGSPNRFKPVRTGSIRFNPVPVH